MSTAKPAAPPIRVPLAMPDITDLEREAVMRVLDGPVLSLGPELEAFEQGLAQQAGTAHAVALSSGTAALHLALASMGIGPGDEVITTPFSFIASANCILFQGATPVFADIDPQTLNIDPARAEERITPRTRAIIGVDVFGHPADWDGLRDVARRHGLRLIEDSAEAIGATYRGRPAGGLGDAGVFAFYPNKQVTTGEGGALLTDDPDIASLARSMRNQGRADGPAWLEHPRLGYNYRLSEMNCALGSAQLSRLPGMLAARARVAERYTAALEDMPGAGAPFVAGDVGMSWFVYAARLGEWAGRQQRDRIIGLMREDGIGTSNYFPCIHLEPLYKDMGFGEGDFPNAEHASGRTIALPFHTRLPDNDIDYTLTSLKKAIGQVR